MRKTALCPKYSGAPSELDCFLIIPGVSLRSSPGHHPIAPSALRSHARVSEGLPAAVARLRCKWAAA